MRYDRKKSYLTNYLAWICAPTREQSLEIHRDIPLDAFMVYRVWEETTILGKTEAVLHRFWVKVNRHIKRFAKNGRWTR